MHSRNTGCPELKGIKTLIALAFLVLLGLLPSTIDAVFRNAASMNQLSAWRFVITWRWMLWLPVVLVVFLVLGVGPSE